MLLMRCNKASLRLKLSPNIRAKMVSALQTIPVPIKPVMSAGAFIATTSLATTQHAAASKSKFLAKEHAAVMSTSTMMYSAADTFLSIILKDAAEKSLSTMKWMNAKLAKSGFATVSANMCLATTGSTSVANKAATLLALNSKQCCKSGGALSPDLPLIDQIQSSSHIYKPSPDKIERIIGLASIKSCLVKGH